MMNDLTIQVLERCSRTEPLLYGVKDPIQRLEKVTEKEKESMEMDGKYPHFTIRHIEAETSRTYRVDYSCMVG